MIGDLPCELIAVTSSEITCKTSPYGTTATQAVGLAVKVYVRSQVASLATKLYYYSPNHTPVIRSVYPSTVFGPTKIQIWGKHGISIIGDGRNVAGDRFSVSVGNTVCTR